jgi:hypothetical protein
MLLITPLQLFFQNNPQLCPDHYRFSVHDLRRSCPAFSETDPFYRTASLFIGVFSALREQLLCLNIFDFDANSLTNACVELVNHDAIVAFKQQTTQTKPTIVASPRDLMPILAARSVTSASGSVLNLNESFPAFADTLQTILDALPHLTQGIVMYLRRKSVGAKRCPLPQGIRSECIALILVMSKNFLRSRRCFACSEALSCENL